MSDMKSRMIDAIERGDTTEDQAYDYVRESMADGADRRRKAEKENLDSQDSEKDRKP